MGSGRNKTIFILSSFACVWTLIVIVLGAYVRLSHAGLGCPDWPGCYGHIMVPEAAEKISSIHATWPERPLHGTKAWKEMTHRYFAGSLGLLILAISLLALKSYGRSRRMIIPAVLLVLIVFQALLGMWTVTLLLKPLVVTAHLLGGMTTLALLVWLSVSQAGLQPAHSSMNIKTARCLAVTGLVFLGLQIALGGWVSSNYAALACYGFPQCSGQWWPQVDFKDAFVLWRGLGIDYEGGVLDHPARVAIQLTHRIGALLVFIVLASLAVYLWRRARNREFMFAGTALALLLCIQIALGIANVTFGLPLAVATAHNATAALLLAVMIYLLYRLRSTGNS
ncbi:MAG TPA: COX15/CtaA family protein [Gammaproteobacteria bacterium]